MKTLALAMMSLIFVALNAQAFEGVLLPQANGDVKVQEVKVICEEQPPMAGENGIDMICRPADGKNCGSAYRPMHKYCWGGFRKGFQRCGIVCEKIRNGGGVEAGQGGD